MHIIQVNHMFLDGGGREEHVFQISKYLALKGHKVTIVTSDYTPTGDYFIKKKADKIPGIKLVTLKGYLTNIPPGRIQIPDLMDFLIDYQGDIIHAHGMGEGTTEDAFHVAKIKKIPFVFTLHFAPYFVYEKLGAAHIWKVLQTYHVFNMLRGSDRIVCVSPNEKEDIIKCTNYKGDNFEIIPNGFEREPEQITAVKIKEVFQKYSIPEGRKYVVFIGPLTNPRKGAFEAIQAFRRAREKYPDLHLILIGAWDGRLNIPGRANVITKVLAKLAKANHVTVTGRVTDMDKYCLLSGSHVFISPTMYEAFGIALAEALYCKIPVVTTDIGGCRYVVRNGVDGILVKNQEDIASFSQAIVELVKNPEKAIQMGKEGSKRMKNIFSWEKTGDKLEILYKNLIRNYKNQQSDPKTLSL
ncbi:MAG: hypothetical protein A2905_01485 [Candidatus Levybacteria bacterium RIFCSPLOWO2_01_FULL_36_10]|nr:MAG: hypothetical protein A2905_01485 [Candidatus Levybacteria bacterium RIFCSPLOWO2_01_FULL_36_10]